MADVHVEVLWTCATLSDSSRLFLDEACATVAKRLSARSTIILSDSASSLDAGLSSALAELGTVHGKEVQDQLDNMQIVWYGEWQHACPMFPLMRLDTTKNSRPLGMQLPLKMSSSGNQSGNHDTIRLMAVFVSPAAPREELSGSSTGLFVRAPFGHFLSLAFGANETLSSMASRVSAMNSTSIRIQISFVYRDSDHPLSPALIASEISSLPNTDNVAMVLGICCTEGHVCEEMYEKPASYGGVRCDVCRSMVDPAEGMAHCHLCKWDLCVNCAKALTC